MTEVAAHFGKDRGVMKEAGTLAAIFFGMFLFGLAAGMPIVAVPAFGLALLFQVMASIGPPQKAKTRIR